jgi:hypothetical protein
MDVDEVWRRILKGASKVAAAHPKDTDALDLAYDIHTLGEWFSNGRPGPSSIAHLDGDRTQRAMELIGAMRQMMERNA